MTPDPPLVTHHPSPGKADLHIHSAASDGTADVREILHYTQEETDLDVIAITDHDRIDAALEARALAEERGGYRFEVIVGCEVTTLHGHLLALDLLRPVAMCRPLHRTIEAVHAQGGVCIVPHPFSWLTRSVGQRALEAVVQGRYPGVAVDGLEVLNPSPAGRVTSARVDALNRARYRLSATGSSDSHHLATIGSAHTLFPGRTAADLRRALATGLTAPGGRHWSARQVLDLMAVRSARRYRRALAITMALAGRASLAP